MTMTKPEQTGESQIVTTEELIAMLERGDTVYLPDAQIDDLDILAHYDADELSRLEVPADENDIVSIEYIGEEEVQCISVEDERHLYLTDDFIPTHNTSNIVFLKSTDDSMIETLEKMSGTRHVTHRDSKTVTRDAESLLKMQSVDSKVSYTMNTAKEPVIKYNDLAFLTERNSIVFRAGDPPVWNRNETILPMSWRLFKDTIVHPGHDYTLQTLPTLSTALDFDVQAEQPDFEQMLNKRMRQAELAVGCRIQYQEAFDYSDVDIARLDKDVYADEVMELVDVTTREEAAEEMGYDNPDEVDPSGIPMEALEQMYDVEADHEQAGILQEQEAKEAERQEKRFADGQISVEMMVQRDNSPTFAFDEVFVETYRAISSQLSRDSMFSVDANGDLRSADHQTMYIRKLDESEAQKRLREAADAEDERVFAEKEDVINQLSSYEVTAEFYQLLAEQSSWVGIADGQFDREVSKQMRLKEDAMSV